MSSVNWWKPLMRASCLSISVRTPKTSALLAPSVSSRFSSRTRSTVRKLSVRRLVLPVRTILMMLVMACLRSPPPPPVLTLCRVEINSLS